MCRLTARWGSFLVVRGVLPRNLPGVLKTSVKLLGDLRKMLLPAFEQLTAGFD